MGAPAWAAGAVGEMFAGVVAGHPAVDGGWGGVEPFGRPALGPAVVDDQSDEPGPAGRGQRCVTPVSWKASWFPVVSSHSPTTVTGGLPYVSSPDAMFTISPGSTASDLLANDSWPFWSGQFQIYG